MTTPGGSARSARPGQRPAVAAGVACGLTVFAIGFAVGSVRVLWVAPRIGSLAAVILEAPLMLAACWVTCRWGSRRFRVGDESRTRTLMGAVAFLTLMLVECAMAVLAFGESPASYLGKFATAPGAVGLGAQLCLAAIPRAEAAWRRRVAGQTAAG
jgi:hypothetical protein